MTKEEKEAAKAAKKAEKEAAKALADSSSGEDAGQPASVAPVKSVNDENWYKSLGYKDPKTGVNLVLADKPESDKAWVMAKFLSEQPKVLTVYPCEQGEVAGKAVTTKTRNGFRLNIVKGVHVLLPLVISEEMMKSREDTERAKSPILTIEDPITHKLITIQANLENASPNDRAMLGM